MHGVNPYVSRKKYVQFTPFKPNIMEKRFYKRLKASFIVITLLLLALNARAQEQTVTGSVISGEDQLGIPGVNVIIKGTTSGTITDADGNYRVSVPNEGILVFSSVGFTTQEVSVDGRAVIDLTLAEDVTSLTEVVVVGYGSQLKREVTGSVQTIGGRRYTGCAGFSGNSKAAGPLGRGTNQPNDR